MSYEEEDSSIGEGGQVLRHLQEWSLDSSEGGGYMAYEEEDSSSGEGGQVLRHLREWSLDSSEVR